MLQVMAKKNPPPQTQRPRLVVYVDPSEHRAITKDANALGLKNAHQWAGMKLATSIREAVERK